MTNKYQEALNSISKFSIQDKNTGKIFNINVKSFKETEISILQELIDNQADYQSYKDLKAEYENKIAILEKALDKTCKTINEQFDGCMFCDMKKCNTKYENVIECGIKKLKEHILKESEKQ